MQTNFIHQFYFDRINIYIWNEYISFHFYSGVWRMFDVLSKCH